MDRIRSYARSLRKNPTDAERALWNCLRFWQVGGHKFRRQQPIGDYIVDFVCLEKKIIIEVDGGQHAEQEEYDSARDVWLRDKGYSVVRFWNNDVLHNLDGVKETISQALGDTPFLSPSPQGGRRRRQPASNASNNRS